jgi:hypothetical protein
MCIREFPDYILLIRNNGERHSFPVNQSEIEAYRDYVLKQLKISHSLPLTLYNKRRRSICVLPRDMPIIPTNIDYGLNQMLELLRKTYNNSCIESKISVIEGDLLSIPRLTIALLN